MISKGKKPSAPPADVELLTLEEVAFLLRVSPRSVRRLIAEGKLRAVKVTVGRTTLRVRREEIPAFLRESEFIEGVSPSRPGDDAESRRKLDARMRVKASWNTGEDPFAEKPKKPRGMESNGK